MKEGMRETPPYPDKKMTDQRLAFLIMHFWPSPVRLGFFYLRSLAKITRNRFAESCSPGLPLHVCATPVPYRIPAADPTTLGNGSRCPLAEKSVPLCQLRASIAAEPARTHRSQTTCHASTQRSLGWQQGPALPQRARPPCAHAPLSSVPPLHCEPPDAEVWR